MFILTQFSDLIQIPPHEFSKASIHAIEDRINSKYANRVYPRVGLCICLYDVLTCSDGLIGYGSGNANVKTQFRMIVFRPFKGEILKGKVKKCTPLGIQISTDFFEDIFAPKTMLFDGCVFDETDGVWVWRTEESELWFDIGTVVNVRVEAEKWQNPVSQTVSNKDGVNGENGELEVVRSVPYSIEVSMTEPGLGAAEWW